MIGLMIRVLFGFALVIGGCIKHAQQIIAPEPEGGGTLSCAEIVETCDRECGDPLCLHRCSAHGTPEARPLHDAMLACGQRNGCTDEDCMRTSCAAEITDCLGEHVPSTGPGSSEEASPPEEANPPEAADG
jgi:hypothetical protein